VAVEDGFRESAQSWRELLLRLRDENGLATYPGQRGGYYAGKSQPKDTQCGGCPRTDQFAEQ
jgi:hypothetical protein